MIRCVQEGEASIQHPPGARSSSVTTGFLSLLRRQVLKDQGILGRYEIAERHLVKRELPEEGENPVAVNLRSAWQMNLLNFPAASLVDRLADLQDQSLLGVVLEVRRTASVQIGRIGSCSIQPSWLAASFGHSLIRTRVSGIGQAW